MHLLIYFASIVLAATINPGDMAPQFELIDTNTKTHSLKNYRGKIVVLEWVNYECPFIKKHYDSQNMQKLQKEFTKKDIVWLSILSSAPGKQGHYPPKTLNEMIKKKGAFPSALLLDTDGKVGLMYSAKTTPHMYIIDKKGLLAYNGAIDSIASTDTEDVPKAQNYVSEGLKRLIANQALKIKKTRPYGCSVKY